MSIPNHAQTARIHSDIQTLQNGRGDALEPWRGNSYKGIPVTVSVHGHTIRHGIKLKHWDTTIAIITSTGPVYFNARYISQTTRAFQGRILNALRAAYGDDHASVVRIAEELAMPTVERDVLDWMDDNMVTR